MIPLLCGSGYQDEATGANDCARGAGDHPPYIADQAIAATPLGNRPWKDRESGAA
jgi:hypothetical protein